MGLCGGESEAISRNPSYYDSAIVIVIICSLGKGFLASFQLIEAPHEFEIEKEL